MKKLALISLISVIALGSVGIGYGRWSQTIQTTDTVNTGTFAIQFQQAVTNDDSTTNNMIDPTNQGSWSWTSGALASSGWSGSRRTDGNNDASTTIVGGVGTATLSIAMVGTYPGYWSSVGCTLKNTGTIPIKVNTVTNSVTAPSGGSSSDVSISFSDALVQSSHTLINPNAEVLGAVYIHWNTVPSTDARTYTLTVTVNAMQWNTVQ